MKWLIERNTELLEAIDFAKKARESAEVGISTETNRLADLEVLRGIESRAREQRTEFLAKVAEDLLFAIRVTADSNSLALSNVLDETYPNLQIRTLIADVAQIARAVAALEAKAK